MNMKFSASLFINAYENFKWELYALVPTLNEMYKF